VLLQVVVASSSCRTLIKLI